MYIKKVIIHNFKCFGEQFEVNFKSNLNILVGDNESGKSTILEAINLTLSKTINGGRFGYELSQDLFNKDTAEKYIADHGDRNSRLRPTPPHMEIDVYLDGFGDESGETEENRLKKTLLGNGNLHQDNSTGVRFLWQFDDKYREELEKLQTIKSLPIEYYSFRWEPFSREPLQGYSPYIPKAFIIDSAKYHLYGGHDSGIYKVVQDDLPDESATQIHQAYRQLQDDLSKQIGGINDHIGEQLAGFSKKKVELGISSLRGDNLNRVMTTYVDDVPFQLAGMGERSMIKTKLALASSSAQKAQVILIEEPECHLSHSNLNILLDEITRDGVNKQIIVSTHSSFVANKLGLNSLIIMAKSSPKTPRMFTELSSDDSKFFKTLPGYDTLRAVLCRAAILVEGPSDELIVQKAYRQKHGKLPIGDGVEVISVGTSAPRFLEMMRHLNTRVAVVVDTDGDITALKKRYADYTNSSSPQGASNIFLAFNNEDASKKFSNETKAGLGNSFNYNTLEPILLLSLGCKKLRSILGKPDMTESQLLKYIHNNKTQCTLEIFKSDDVELNDMPNYILNAVDFVAS